MLACADRKRSSPVRSCACRSDRFLRPVGPLEAETLRKPKTTGSGGTSSELVDLGLSWSRQATQNALRHRREEKKRIRVGKARVWEKRVKVDVLIRLWLKNLQLAVAFIFIGRGSRTPSKSLYTRIPKIKQSLLGLQLGRSAWPVGLWLCQIWLSTDCKRSTRAWCLIVHVLSGRGVIQYHYSICAYFSRLGTWCKKNYHYYTPIQLTEGQAQPT